MLDGIFFINNALRVNRLSVFTDDQRFQQTLETLNSIDRYCPNNRKFMFDSSPVPPEKEKVDNIANRGCTVFYMGQEQNVNLLSNNGLRSIAESITFLTFMGWFREQNFEPARRIYKLSGRYSLNGNFVPNHPSFENAFVFAKPIDTWMPEDEAKAAGVTKLYPLRFWHMDYHLLPQFHNELARVLEECAQHNIDIEHGYYKLLHNKYKVIELDKIGVHGNIAPSGEYINE